MGPRNLLILFFSTVAVSLVILIIFFSLFFKNVDLNFNTRLPESAPDIGRQYATGPTMSPDSKAEGLLRSTVNVPPEFQEPPPPAKGDAKAKKDDDELPSDAELPPVTDDALLENDSPLPSPDRMLPEPTERMAIPEVERSNPSRTGRTPSTAPQPRIRPQSPPPVAMPEPLPDEDNEASGPPVPGQ